MPETPPVTRPEVSNIILQLIPSKMLLLSIIDISLLFSYCFPIILVLILLAISLFYIIKCDKMGKRLGGILMDITGLQSASLSAANTINDVSVRMLAKSLDSMEELGDGMKKMLEMSVTPYIGSNIDISL